MCLQMSLTEELRGHEDGPARYQRAQLRYPVMTLPAGRYLFGWVATKSSSTPEHVECSLAGKTQTPSMANEPVSGWPLYLNE